MTDQQDVPADSRSMSKSRSATEAPRAPRSGVGRLLPHSVQGTLLFVLLVVIVPILLFETGLNYASFATRRTQELQANLEVARAVAATFDAYANDILHQESAIGAALTSSQPPSVEDARRILVESAREYPSVSYYRWVSPQGRVLVSSRPETVDPDITPRPYFQQIAQGREWVVTELFVGRTGGEVMFVIARGIRGEDGALRGIVVAGVDPSRLGGVLKLERAQLGAISIIDHRGWAVYRYPEVELAWEERNWIETRPDLARVLAGEEVTGSFVSGVDGQMLLAGLSPIPSIGWIAGASRPEAETMAPVLQDLAQKSGLLLLVSLMALLAAVTIGRSITSPIGRLRGRALAIGGGELGPYTRVTGPTELEDLAAAFNRMAAEIEVRQEHGKRLTAESQRRAAELDVTLASIADGVLIYTPKAEIVRMNPAATSMLGRPPGEAKLPLEMRIALRQVETADGKVFAPEETPVQRALRGERVHSVVMVIHLPGGKDLWVTASAGPLRSPAGRLLGAVSVLTDITALHELEEQREEYIHMVSHDLRTPLTIVQGRAQLLQRMLEKAGQEESHRRSVEAIITASRRMNGMIQDLVDAARLETKQLRLNQLPVKLRHCVLDLKQLLAGALATDRLHVEVPEDLPPGLGRPGPPGAHPHQSAQQCPQVLAFGDGGAAEGEQVRGGSDGLGHGSGGGDTSRRYSPPLRAVLPGQGHQEERGAGFGTVHQPDAGGGPRRSDLGGE